MLRRIPYEEWGLKSIPALSETRRKELEAVVAEGGKGKVEVLFPGTYLKEGKVLETLKKLATERQALHKSKMIWSLGIAPLTAPFMLVPIVPNIPFFYMVFRGWSHWRGKSISLPHGYGVILLISLCSTQWLKAPRIFD